MNNFVRCVAGLMLAGLCLLFMWAPGLKGEERFIGLISLIGLVFLFTVGYFNRKKNCW